MVLAGATGKSFVITRAGIVHQSPGYTMPKDKNVSMLALVEKRAKLTPGPDEHSTDLSWNAIYGNFGAGKPGRKTFFDDAMKRSEKIPCPTEYNNELSYRDQDGMYRTRRIAER
jgi:hypothetical protein